MYDKGVIKSGNGQIYGEFHYRLHSGDIYSPQLQMSEPLAKECAHFIECVREGKRPVSDGLNGLQVVRVLEAAQSSLENLGLPVKIQREYAAPVKARPNSNGLALPRTEAQGFQVQMSELDE